MKILIIHPEGNIHNNPNLSAIAGVFCKNGFKVDILAQRHTHVNQNALSSFKIFFLRNISFIENAFRYRPFHCRFLRWLLKLVGRKYNLIIGVDRDGIVIGDIISKLTQVPLALISYEIIFRDEVDPGEKIREVSACKNIRFAICQDFVRAEKLSEENNIVKEKIICVPVAGRKIVEEFGRKDYLREKFGISQDTNIALYMGSLDEWAFPQNFLEDIRFWPENWALVLHGRYRGDEQYRRFERLRKDIPGKIYLSKEPFERFPELYQQLLSAEIGIAMYYPSWSTSNTGKNLQYLGWSSGKVSTYFQCGLPVIINEVGLISDDIINYDLGYVLRKNEKISDVLKHVERIHLLPKKKNCRKFFSQHLDLDLCKDKILSATGETTQRTHDLGSIIQVSVLTKLLNLYHLVTRVKNRIRNGLC